MAELQQDHRIIGRELAAMSGADLTSAPPAIIRTWEARGLALQALARGDMDEAEKIIAHAKGGAA